MRGEMPASVAVVGLEVDGVPLDGRSFEVEVVRPGARPTAERLRFSHGRLEALECAFYGFDPGGYEAEVRGWAVRFTSESASASEGRIRWEGRVAGDRIEGTVLWMREGLAPIRGTFSGRARSA